MCNTMGIHYWNCGALQQQALAITRSTDRRLIKAQMEREDQHWGAQVGHNHCSQNRATRLQAVQLTPLISVPNRWNTLLCKSPSDSGSFRLRCIKNTPVNWKPLSENAVWPGSRVNILLGDRCLHRPTLFPLNLVFTAGYLCNRRNSRDRILRWI